MRSKFGQSTLEFTVLIIVFMGALIAMSPFIKRSLQGGWKERVEGLGEPYDPRLADAAVTYRTTGSSSSVVEAVPGVDEHGNAGFYTQRLDTATSTETKHVDSTIGSIKE